MMARYDRKTNRTVSMLLATMLLLAGCVIVAFVSSAQADMDPDDKFHRDRKAILAMAGNYHVNFSFRETVAFVEGYKLKEPYEPDGYEIVRVIRDDGKVISLQHVLVTRGIWDDHVPTKHWRQDWVYEPAQVFEYLGHNVWRTRRLEEAERRGKWGQFVYQVDDSPRYAAVADWVHDQGVSSWTSPPTWRPLPRRDASKRSDYDVLVSVNRHGLTPHGWVHEQDSAKLILRDRPQLLVREFGVNTYTVSDDFKVRMAEEYWKDTKMFWAEVREEWKRLEDEPGTFGVITQTQSGKLYNHVLTLANDAREGKLAMTDAAKQARDIIRASTTRDMAELNARMSQQDQKQEYAR